MDKNEDLRNLGAFALGGLPLLWGLLGGASMDEKEETLQKACDDADRHAQYLLRMVNHQMHVVVAYKRGLENDVKQALPLSELQGAVRDAMWAVGLESARQLLFIYEDEEKKAEQKWRAATEALLHYRNEQELLRQKKAEETKARHDIIWARISEKYPGRTFRSYDKEWIEESLAYDRECEAEAQKGPPTEPAPEP